MEEQTLVIGRHMFDIQYLIKERKLCRRLLIIIETDIQIHIAEQIRLV